MAKILKSPAKLFLILASVFGIIWVFLMPAGAGYDEETHLARIYEIDHRTLLPNQWLGVAGNGIPISMREISYRQKAFLLPITMGEIKDQLSLKLESEITIPHLTRATYSPALYFPQAVLLKIFGFNFDLPLLLNYWIIRLSYLFLYICLSYFAIRLMPKFKWTLFVLALAPMAMIQAVSISADPQTNGMSFLFVAWSLYLIEGKKSVDKKNFWITMLLVFLLFIVKPNSTPLVLLLILLKPTQFSNRRTLAFFWLAIAALFLIEVGGWTMIQFQAEAARRGLTETQTAGFLTVFLSDPLGFIANLVRYVVTNLPTVFQQYIAGFGYGYYAMPTAVYIFFLIGLGAGILHDWQLEAFSKSTRILLALAFIVLFFGTFALRLAIKQSVGSLALSQGRYFIPFIPLLIFSVFGGRIKIAANENITRLVTSTAVALTLILVTVAMYLVYYVPCGMYVYSPGKCMIPVYKNWDPTRENSIVIQKDQPVEQIFQPDCGKTDSLSLFTFTSLQPPAEGNFVVELTQVKTGENLFSQEFPISSLQDNAMTTIDMPPIQLDTNGQYQIGISSDSSLPAFSIGLSDRQRIRGSLSQAGIIIEKDLLFKYGCIK